MYSLPPGLPSNGDTSDVSDIITPLQDLETDMNTARPIVAGGTGATSASAARTALGLGTAATKSFLDEDDMASDDATAVASQQSIKAFVKFSKEYQSTGQTMVSGGLLTLAHGLGAEPKLIRLYAVNTTAEHGYAIGEKFDITAIMSRGTTNQNARGFAVKFDNTNIYIRNGSDTDFADTVSDNAGLAVSLARANWDLYVEAWA